MSRGRKSQQAIEAEKAATINEVVEAGEHEGISLTTCSDTVHVRCAYRNGLVYDIDSGLVTIQGKNGGMTGRLTDRRPLPIGSWGKTEINKNDWEAIVRKFGHTPIFKNGIIFACKTEHEADMEAKSRGAMHTNLDPLPQSTPKTNPKEK